MTRYKICDGVVNMWICEVTDDPKNDRIGWYPAPSEHLVPALIQIVGELQVRLDRTWDDE